MFALVQVYTDIAIIPQYGGFIIQCPCLWKKCTSIFFVSQVYCCETQAFKFVVNIRLGPPRCQRMDSTRDLFRRNHRILLHPHKAY